MATANGNGEADSSLMGVDVWDSAENSFGTRVCREVGDVEDVDAIISSASSACFSTNEGGVHRTCSVRQQSEFSEVYVTLT